MLAINCRLDSVCRRGQEWCLVTYKRGEEMERAEIADQVEQSRMVFSGHF